MQKSGILFEGVTPMDMWRNAISEGDFLAQTDVEGRKYREQTGLDNLVVYTVNYECCDLLR